VLQAAVVAQLPEQARGLCLSTQASSLPVQLVSAPSPRPQGAQPVLRVECCSALASLPAALLPSAAQVPAPVVLAVALRLLQVSSLLESSLPEASARPFVQRAQVPV
jgi:hypothetical protein